MKCPKCQYENPYHAKFCMECGHNLVEASAEIKESVPEAERKHATVLFSDLAGYTSLTEKLDPEEVKEIMGRIFTAAARIIEKYEGTVERFFGDEIMALFGVPKAHEDDPLRSIRAAREINESMAAISRDWEQKLSRSLRMHTGINTGLMVTGDEYIGKSRHGLTGDTINLAKRLTTLAGEDEIIIGPDTWNQAQDHFIFEELSPVQVKGKSEPIKLFKVLSPKDQPSALHRTHGARADLIGRDREMAILEQSVEELDQGQGAVIAISGDAGTGKSRLTREFKDRLDLDRIQWYEGHAYGYTQNTPYYPLIDLLAHAFQIEEGDPSERIREKIELGIANLLGAESKAAAYIGGLFSLSYPEVTQVSPEFWKSRLHSSILEIVSALANRGPTVICFEDLHWADPSFIELLNSLLKSPSHSILFVCVYRPSFNLFDGQNPESLDQAYQEIRLQELSALNAQAMLRSLLKSGDIPAELMDFIGKKAEGNPFYLEEVINSLIESEILTRDNGSWKLARAIGETDIPSSISGVLTARIDRLQKDAKQVLQEASVIGRAFFYEILKRVSNLKVPIDQYLAGLEQLDLIRVRALEPDLEYIFKHTLTQEVVYNGILKKERQEIHERIGFAIETLFKNRLPEFYETLAHHFSHSSNVGKAIDYLMKAGEKSAKKYSLDEAHQYFKEAYKIITDKADKTKAEIELLMDLLIQWSYVFNYRGDFKNLHILLTNHINLAESTGDKGKLSMLYGWLGFCLYHRSKIKDAYAYLSTALKIGQELKDASIIAYASTWLTWVCTEMGLLQKAVNYGENAMEILNSHESDHYLYMTCRSAVGYAYFRLGYGEKAAEVGAGMLNYGRKFSSNRNMTLGHMIMGFGYFTSGDLISARISFKKAIQISLDPFYTELVRIFLSACYIIQENFQEAEPELKKVLQFSKNFGAEIIGIPAYAWLGVVLIVKGQMRKGMKMLKEGMRECKENERISLLAHLEYTAGKVYMQLFAQSTPISFFIILKNIIFLLQNLPFAFGKAINHFNRAIRIAENIGSKQVLSQTYLDLGLLYKLKGEKDTAQKYILKAASLYEECGAKVYLKQAKEILESLR